MANDSSTRLYAKTSGTSAYLRAPSTPPPQPNVCAPACADCGLLECLCRPRFFAGQLLTEQDLNRLDAYIRAKNRMHNLQLHGWGVVNGLQVRCDTCGGDVVVGTGYAIDPCGEDIVVCGDTAVDICSLIKRCQPQDITCQPSSRTGGTTTCDDVEEDWVLAIRYTETQARSVTALRSTPSCACGATNCNCGSSCGCGNKMSSTTPTNAMTSTSAQRPKSPPNECEATAICEGYSFDVFPAPTESLRLNPRTLSGALVDTFRCCIEPLIASLPKRPTGTPADQPKQWFLWCCRARQALIAFFSTGPQANCQIVARLELWQCPDQNDPDFATKIEAALKNFRLLFLEAMLSCLCSALLPPAPCGTSDDRVPLAIVTVRKKDCKILRVCNWTSQRKMVITFPTLEYWLSWIPFVRSIQDVIGRFCCADVETRTFGTVGTVGMVAGEKIDYGSVGSAADGTATDMANPYLDHQHAMDNMTLTTLMMNAFARGSDPIDAASMIDEVFGLSTPDKPTLSEEEKANLAPFLLLNEVLRPVVQSLVPESLSAEKQPLNVVDTVMNGGNKQASIYQRIEALEKAIAELKPQ